LVSKSQARNVSTVLLTAHSSSALLHLHKNGNGQERTQGEAEGAGAPPHLNGNRLKIKFVADNW